MGMFDDLIPQNAQRPQAGAQPQGMFDDLIPKPQPNFFANAARGMAERGSDLMGGLIDLGVGISESLPDWAQAGVVYDDQGLRVVTGDEYRQAPSVVGDLADTLRANNAGYVPQGTWENVKNANGIVDTLAEAGKFAVEQGIVSTPDMFMAASPGGLLTYGAMRSGEMARDRATAHGRSEVSATDVSMAVPTAAAVAALEKIGAAGILNPNTAGMGAVKGALVGGATAGGGEAITEAAQNPLEYLAVTPQNKLSWREAGEQALAGAVAGAGYGGPLGAVSGGLQGTQPGPVQQQGPTDQQKLDILRAIETLAPAYVPDGARPIDPGVIEQGNERLRGGYDQIADLFQRTGTSPSPGVAVEQTTLDEVEGQPAQEPPLPVRLNDQLADMAAKITELRNRPAMNIDVDEQGPKVTEIEALPAPDARLNEPFPPPPPKKGTKVEDISGLLEEIELAPPPQEQRALPPPAMPVDSRGVAATPAMQQSLEQRAFQAERAGNVEGAMAMRRDALTPDLRPQAAPATDGIEAAFQPTEEIEALPAPDGTRLSRAVPNQQGAPVRRGPDVGRLQQAFEGLTSSLKGAAPVRVVATSSELPAHIRAKMEAESAEGVAGVYDSGTVYMVADELPNPVKAARTYFHEQVAHAGLRGLFDIANSPEGKQAFDKLLDDVVAAGRAGKLDLREDEFADAREAAEEYIARTAEGGARDPAGVMPRVRVMVAQALRKVPVLGRYFKHITQAEIDALLARARRYTEEGGAETQAFRGSRFARGLPGDTRFARRIATKTSTGKYHGAPTWVKTPADLSKLRKLLRTLTKEGEAGRFWYERSARAVLKIAGGNYEDAEKLIQLIAIYSPQNPVRQNMMDALNAWYLWKAGVPESQFRVRPFGATADANTDSKAADVLYRGLQWDGRKTNSFYSNLMYELNKMRGLPVEDLVTSDLWVARAFGYDNDAFPSGNSAGANKYDFSEAELRDIAGELGWTPHQVQAALWSAIKARYEQKGVKASTNEESLRRGWSYWGQKAGKKVLMRYPKHVAEHRALWRENALKAKVDKKTIDEAVYDFASAIDESLGQVSWEARPGVHWGFMPDMHEAPDNVQRLYLRDMARAFLDKDGNDILARKVGILSPGEIEGAGAFEGEVAPGAQRFIAAPKGPKMEGVVDAATRKLIGLYAAARGLVLRQDAMAWHKPFYTSTVAASNGMEVRIGRPIRMQEAARLYAETQKIFGTQDVVPIPYPGGVRFLNFVEGLDNKEFHKGIEEATKRAFSTENDIIATLRRFASDGEYIDGGKHGENYRRRIQETDRSGSLLGWVRDVLAPKIDAVNERYQRDHGWGGDPESEGGTDLRFSRRVGGGRQAGGRAADSALEAPERSAAREGQEGLAPLPGAPKVPGYHGPDPRVVSVAERYARENNIPLRRQSEYAQVDPERARRIAAAYEAMPHAPNDPKVREAYENLVRQTIAQYRALERAGYKFWFMDMSRPDNAEYASTPWNQMRDLRETQSMGVFPTDDGFGTGEPAPTDNVMLQDTGIKWPSGSLDGPLRRVLANDLFRAVHDAFGHGMEGAGFREHGEENAWQAHVRLFTGSAVGAITSETRGQNSWLNYGPHGEANRTAKVEDTVFAEQKTGLMPEWTWTEGRVGDSDTRLSRRINKLGFYSALEDQLANNVPMKAAPVDGWKGVLKGLVAQGKVKADEVEWSGISEWLDLQQGKVTRDQIVEYLKQGGVQVEESVRKQGARVPKILVDYFAAAGRRLPESRGGWERWVDEFVTFAQQLHAIGNTEQRDRMLALADAAQGHVDEGFGENRPKFEQYTLPGGDDYREVLLTLQDSKERVMRYQVIGAFPQDGFKTREEAQKYIDDLLSNIETTPHKDVASRLKFQIERFPFSIQEYETDESWKQRYQSPHWDEPNVLAHARTKDRTDADGKRVLFVEEIQSDWAQEGRKKGFKSDRSAQVIEDERNELVRRRNALLEEAANLPDSEMRRFKSAMAEADALRQRISELDQEHDRVLARGPGVPRAPFVQNTESWVTLALKRIITMAVQEGHDRVAFVTGSQSATRYNLRSQVENIAYYVNPDGSYEVTVVPKKGPNIIRDELTIEQVEEFVGKEIAKKVQAGEGERRQSGITILRGVDLEVGGEGMMSFYDKLVPSALKKLLPKLGGKLSTAQIELDENKALDRWQPEDGEGDGSKLPAAKSQHLAFDITPEMKEKVGQGVPLFSRKLPAKPGAQPTMMDTWREKVGEPAWNKIANAVTPLLSMVKLADAVPAEFKQQMRQYRAEMQREARSIQGVAERASVLSPAERNMLSDFIERVMQPGVIPPAHVRDIATAMRAALANQREELISMRMLSEDVRERWGDEYIARYYAKHVIDKPWDKVIRAAHKKIDGSHLRGRGLFEPVKRADIPKYEALGWEVRHDNDGDQVVMWRDFTEAEREKMGEIRDGVYRFVRGYLESSRDIATGHLFERMAEASYTQDSDPGTGDYVEVPKTVVGGMTKGMTWQMKRNPQGQFAPRVAYRYGKLAGKWIPRDVWEQLAPLFEPRNELVAGYLKALSLWKEGKTVLNPVVHSNNVVSNVVSAYWALGPRGLSPEVYRAVAADYASKGRYYTEATDNGLFGTEYYSAEVAALMPQLESQANLQDVSSGKVSRLLDYLNGKLKLGAARRAMQRAYEAEDQFFKLMLYREARLNGAKPEEAIDFAEQYIFNYADVPKGVRILRSTTHPFFAYTYKAVPMVLRTMLMHPERLLATFLLFSGVNWLSFALLGDEGDEDEERKVMPEYMRGRTAVGSPKNVRMPFNFEDGAAAYMDVSRRLPLGDLYDVTNQSGGLALPAPLMPNNPAFTLAVGILANKDMFTGDEIVPEYDQDFPADKYSALGGYLGRQLMPNNPLIPGSYSWNKIMNGIAGSTGEEFAGYTGLDYRGRTQTLPRAVLDTVLGIKLRSVDVDTERQKRMSNQARLARDVKADMRRVTRDQSLSPEQREQRVQELTEKIRRIMDKAQEYRE